MAEAALAGYPADQKRFGSQDPGQLALYRASGASTRRSRVGWTSVSRRSAGAGFPWRVGLPGHGPPQEGTRRTGATLACEDTHSRQGRSASADPAPGRPKRRTQACREGQPGERPAGTLRFQHRHRPITRSSSQTPYPHPGDRTRSPGSTTPLARHDAFENANPDKKDSFTCAPSPDAGRSVRRSD